MNKFPSLHEPACYRIEFAGRLTQDWSEHFGGFEINVETRDNGQVVTILNGKVADQAGLHGILRSIRDLGLPLLKVEWIHS